MSTKTTFKRVALVAVAALGLGVLSVTPSLATVSALTVTGADGTSTRSAASYVSDSTTAATVSVSALLDSVADSITVTILTKSVPTGATGVAFLYALDSTTPTGYTQIDSTTSGAAYTTGQKLWRGSASADTSSAAVAIGSSLRLTASSAGYVGANFAVQLDSTTSRIAGTYAYTAVVKSYSSGVTTPVTTTKDINIVVSASAATVALTGATAIDSGRTTAWLNAGSSYTTASDSAVAVVSTAASTDHATLRVRTYTADGDPAPESVTVTITGAGVICNSSICGKSIKIVGTGGNNDFTVRADGTAGTGSIVVATTTKTFPAKTVTFYAKAAKTLTASVNKPVISTAGDTDVIRVAAVDDGGNNWAGTAYIYASTAADALIAGSSTPVACTYSSTYAANLCPVTGIKSGTAKFKVIDASTVALATATSNEVSVRVSTASAGSVKLSFDKASYAPGERATIWATVLDVDGLAMPSGAITNLFAAGAVTSSLALTKLSTNDLSSVDGTVAGATSVTDPNNPSYAGAVSYVYTMPYTTGTVTLTAKGGTGLATAGRVTVTASAEVVNASADAATDAANEATDAANAATDAALAAADAADAATAAAQDASDAVAALSASVSKMIASLKAQITSLTNLVIKIQKKVRA
jgi:trimeric autotransporter adhesin